MKRFETESSNGWFYLSLNGGLYLFHLSLGKFTMAFEASERRQTLRSLARQAQKAALLAKKNQES